jgi:hypothetical protein
VSGRIERMDGRAEQVTRATLIEVHEAALRAMAAAACTLAVALVIMRLA